MKLVIEIETKNQKIILQELQDIYIQVKQELASPACKGCKACKDPKKGCIVGGGNSEPRVALESRWQLSRKYIEHKKICTSKNKKPGVVVYTIYTS